MFEKILTALKAKYQDKRLPDKVLVAIAKRLATTITDENLIDGAVTAEGETIAEFQSHASSQYAAGEKAGKKPSEEPGKEKPNSQSDAGNGNDPVPAWAQKLIDQNNSLASEVAALKSDKSTATRTGQLEVALANTSDAFRKTTLNAFKRMSFEKEEDFAAYLVEVGEDAKAFVQSDADRKLGVQGKPALPAGGSGTDVKPATKEELDAMMPHL